MIVDPKGESPRSQRKVARRLEPILATAFVGIAIWLAALGLERHNTWYLASDQFAFLTFSEDLESGRIFHDSSFLIRVLGSKRWQPRVFDFHFQTYVFQAGQFFSRYPPGFPAVLALAGLVGGEVAKHLVNPILYLLLMACLAAWTWRCLTATPPSPGALDATTNAPGEPFAWAAAALVPWLLLLLPTAIHLWGITVARDLAAHLFAALALLLVIQGKRFAGAFLLGLGSTVRPDAILYMGSLAALLLLTRRPLKDWVLVAAAWTLGALPLFLYNAATMGGPFRFTQGAEFQYLMSRVLAPAAAWAGPGGAGEGGNFALTTGGAFRFSNLPHSLPENAKYFRDSLGFFLLYAGLGAIWALRRRRMLAAAVLPYALVAFPFYSCWGHPDSRYLAGVCLMLLIFAAVGVGVTVDLLTRAARSPWWRLLGILVVLLAVVAGFAIRDEGRWTPLGRAEIAVGLGIVVAGLMALARRRDDSARPTWTVILVSLPLISIAALGLWRASQSSGFRDPFQRQQVEQARRTIEDLMPAGSVVFTTDSLGRPAENITHYTHAVSIYDVELHRLGVDAHTLARSLVAEGRRVFYLVGPEREQILPPDTSQYVTRRVGRRAGNGMYDWFADPRRAPLGASLFELEPTAEMRKSLEFFWRGFLANPPQKSGQPFNAEAYVPSAARPTPGRE